MGICVWLCAGLSGHNSPETGKTVFLKGGNVMPVKEAEKRSECKQIILDEMFTFFIENLLTRYFLRVYAK